MQEELLDASMHDVNSDAMRTVNKDAMHGVNNTVKLDSNSAARLLLVALAVGVISDALLRQTPFGLNVLLVVLGLLAAAWLIGRWSGFTFNGEGGWLTLPAIGFAFALAWRDSPTLNVANWIALVVTGMLAALTAREGQVRLAGLSQYLVGVAYLLGHSFAGLFPTLRREVPWRSVHAAWWANPAVAVGRGFAIALPPLFIFGALFVAADANFEKLVDDVFTFNGAELITHALLIALYAWLVGGMLREMLVVPLRPRQALLTTGFRLGTVEIGVVLALIDLLFAVFVVLQLPYLFGGVREVAQMGYSEYARRGFFELVWVAGLTLPLLLWAHWLMRDADRTSQRVYKALAFGMVILLFVIMASAVQRMQLYVEDSGLTELRVQASAFMGWLAIVLVWFVATVLRDRRRQFAFGALVSAMVVIGALDVASPDAMIVRTNAAFGHLEPSGAFDARPLASLSADAAPAIVESLSQLTPATRDGVLWQLRARYAGDDTSSDWRSFNVSRALARAAITDAPR